MAAGFKTWDTLDDFGSYLYFPTCFFWGNAPFWEITTSKSGILPQILARKDFAMLL